MATIKTQLVGSERRILTKNGLISCSCCEAGCCMYPADQLGIGYMEEDLPDEIYLYYRIAGRVSEGIMTRSGSTYVIDPLLGEVTASVVFGIAWQFTGLFYVTDDFLSFQNICLIKTSFPFVPPEDGDTQSVDSIVDQFSDTYTVNTYDDFVGGSPVSSFVITRTELCLWTGFDGRYGGGTDVSLRYTAPTPSSTRSSMWTMRGFGRVDGGPFKSPAGTYLDGNYIWQVVP
jgi:hypothetical protein